VKLIILDRDGVINYDSDQFIKSPQEWRPIEGSMEAIALLNQWGWRVVVATNQSGVGRGLFDMDTLAAIHDKMHRTVAQAGGRIDAIFFCPHAADSKCACRKPKPGMLLEIAERFNVDLNDLQSAVAAGAQPVLVRTGKGGKTEADPELPPGTPVHDNLAAYVRALTVNTD
jgi:D-glycero-D-manno-heptose 1,7-bisphosphate phosphatase